MSRLEAQLAGLATMSPAQLRERWLADFGSAPPGGYGPDLLRRSIAYKLQEKALGALPSALARQIKAAVADHRNGGRGEVEQRLRPGTRLAREWHGRTHLVTVLADGFDYQDRHYRSLTAIAREITGAGWSGPRFFGLRQAAGGNHA